MDRMRSSVKHAKVWGGQKNGLLNEATTRVGRSQVQLSATDVEAHDEAQSMNVRHHVMLSYRACAALSCVYRLNPSHTRYLIPSLE